LSFSLLPVILFSSLIGITGGFLAGFFGIGGGVIFVPGLVEIFKLQHISEHGIKLAIATSKGAIFITALSSSYNHFKEKNARLKEVVFLVSGGIPLSIIGSELAILLDGELLRHLFGVLEIIVAILYLTIISKKNQANNTPTWWTLLLTGSSAGLISGLFGVGGGVIAVPLMNLTLKMPFKRAAGNSSVMILINTLASVITFAISKPNFAVPTGNIGYINIYAALLIGVFSVAMARLGVKTLVKTQSQTAKRYFGFFLIFLGIYFIM